MSWVDPQMGYGQPAARHSETQHWPSPPTAVVNLAAAEERWSETGCSSLIAADASARAFPAQRWSRFEAFLLKMKERQAVHVVALGSSMTLGKECNTDIMPATNPPCAWPARLERLLKRLFAPAAVRVSNLARNGYNTRVWAMENVETIRELRSADLIIHSGAIGDAEFDAASLRAASVLTRTSRGLRTVRTGYVYQPPACCTYRRHRAACPGRPLLYVRRTRTSLRRAVRTAYHATPGARRALGRHASPYAAHRNVLRLARAARRGAAWSKCPLGSAPAPLAVPQLALGASSGRAWRPRAAWYFKSEAQPLSAQPPPRGLKRVASKVADFTAFDHLGDALRRLHGAAASRHPAHQRRVARACVSALRRLGEGCRQDSAGGVNTASKVDHLHGP